MPAPPPGSIRHIHRWATFRRRLRGIAVVSLLISLGVKWFAEWEKSRQAPARPETAAVAIAKGEPLTEEEDRRVTASIETLERLQRGAANAPVDEELQAGVEVSRRYGNSHGKGSYRVVESRKLGPGHYLLQAEYYPGGDMDTVGVRHGEVYLWSNRPSRWLWETKPPEEVAMQLGFINIRPGVSGDLVLEKVRVGKPGDLKAILSRKSDGSRHVLTVADYDRGHAEAWDGTGDPLSR